MAGKTNHRTKPQPNPAHLAQAGIPHDNSKGNGPPPDPNAPFLSDDPHAAYLHFLPLAQAVPAGSERTLKLDPDLVLHNAVIGVDYFKSIQAQVLAKMPSCPVNHYLELPSLTRALLFAADQCIQKGSDGEIRRRIREMGKLRSPMAWQLEVFAHPEIKLADPDIVKSICAGKGPLNQAKGAVQIVAYFKDLGAAVAGKHPFTDGQLAELSENASWLVGQLTPDGAIDVPDTPDPHALVRDQLFSIVWDRYSLLGGAVASVYGLNGLDSVVPPLGARKGTKKAATQGQVQPPQNGQQASHAAEGNRGAPA